MAANSAAMPPGPAGLGEQQWALAKLLDLAAIGQLQITRATNIEFNNTNQFWEVKNPKERVLYFSRSRNACLDWEQHNL